MKVVLAANGKFYRVAPVSGYLAGGEWEMLGPEELGSGTGLMLLEGARLAAKCLA